MTENEIKKELKSVMAQKGINYEKLADMAKMKPLNVYRSLSNKNNYRTSLRVAVLLDYCCALGISPAYLFIDEIQQKLYGEDKNGE